MMLRGFFKLETDMLSRCLRIETEDMKQCIVYRCIPKIGMS